MLSTVPAPLRDRTKAADERCLGEGRPAVTLRAAGVRAAGVRALPSGGAETDCRRVPLGSGRAQVLRDSGSGSCTWELNEKAARLSQHT